MISVNMTSRWMTVQKPLIWLPIWLQHMIRAGSLDATGSNFNLQLTISIKALSLNPKLGEAYWRWGRRSISWMILPAWYPSPISRVQQQGERGSAIACTEAAAMRANDDRAAIADGRGMRRHGDAQHLVRGQRPTTVKVTASHPPPWPWRAPRPSPRRHPAPSAARVAFRSTRSAGDTGRRGGAVRRSAQSRARRPAGRPADTPGRDRRSGPPNAGRRAGRRARDRPPARHISRALEIIALHRLEGVSHCRCACASKSGRCPWPLAPGSQKWPDQS